VEKGGNNKYIKNELKEITIKNRGFLLSYHIS
jgi:hypothetical protein